MAVSDLLLWVGSLRSYYSRKWGHLSVKINKSQISEFVDELYLERGQSYFEQGMVILNYVDENAVDAHCAGSRVYKVNLTFENHRLRGRCTCPAFADFGPCKHIAATAFAMMAQRTAAYNPSRYAVEMIKRHHAVRAKLHELNKEELIDLIEE